MTMPLLLIGGPTATGKTDLALKLAKDFNTDIISADSRQVYKGMDVGTGKDIPAGSTWHISDLHFNDTPIGYYQQQHTKIWGYDLVEPHQSFSVAHWHHFATKAIDQLQQDNKLPIIVGGTGLYHQSLIDPPETLHIQPNKQLRHQLADQKIDDLQETLKQIDPRKLNNMNHSDRHNPRRLIRAIEVAQANKKSANIPTYAAHFVTIIANKKTLHERIYQRVLERMSAMKTEVKQLLSQYPSLKPKAFSATGYRLYHRYLNGDLDRDELINQWVTQEYQYAKRQLTWFNKQEVKVFNLDNISPEEIVANLKSWYANLDESKTDHN